MRIYVIFLPVFRFQWRDIVVSVFVVFLILCSNKFSHASLCREYFRQTVAIKLGCHSLRAQNRALNTVCVGVGVVA